VMLEIQQNSNTTYRLYDWDRLSGDGKPRPLHLKEGLQALHLHDLETPVIMPKELASQSGQQSWLLLQTQYFKLIKVRLQKALDHEMDGMSFMLIFPLQGALYIKTEDGEAHVPMGRTCLVPAGCERVHLQPEDHEVTYLQITLL
jgi:mannose-6-phosphate isomerase